MTALFQDASAQLLIADYAAVDAGGKLNLVGGGITLLGHVPEQGTPPFSVVAILSFPEKYVGQQYTFELELRDGNDRVVSVPDESGQALRLSQLAAVEPVTVPPGIAKPTGLRSQYMPVLNFPTGLPLHAGASYRWKLRVDGQSRKGWEAPFTVMAQLPPPMVGGPANEPHIAGVEDLSPDVDDVDS